jgi:hypothetical protein
MALTVSSAFGNLISVITIWVNKTFSDAGVVQLTSPDWRVEPRVDFNLLADRRDLVRLASGFRQIAAIHELPPLKAVTADAFPASFTDSVRKVGEMNRTKHLTALKNKATMLVGGLMLDGPDWLRQFLLRNFVMQTAPMDQVLRHEGELEAYIKRATVGVWHCCGSCSMGSPDDLMAVTSSSGLVRGIQGLRVVDASIFPQVPCANTNLPTMMVAEKIDAGPVRCLDPATSAAMVHEIDIARKDGDTLGGVVEVLAYGVPPGLGSYVHADRRLDARLAAALMSIQAIKGVEVGDGFETARRRGSQAHDEIENGPDGLRRRTNRAGGIEGGMSTGEVIRVRAAMKPISTVPRALATVDVRTGEAAKAINQRSDVTAVPAAGVVAEAMVALELAAAAAEKFGGDSVAETARNARAYTAALVIS